MLVTRVISLFLEQYGFYALNNFKGFNCDGTKEFIMHPDDCTKFIKCSDNMERQCSNGLRFDYNLQICNWVSIVRC